MTRYLLAVPEFPPEVLGGGGIVFSELAERYSQVGEVLVLAGSWSWLLDKPAVTSLASGGTLVRVPLVRNPLNLPALRSTLAPTLSARSYIRQLVYEWQPTVGHLHGYGYLLVDWVAKLLHSSGIPFVFTSHGLPVSYRSGKLKYLKQVAYRVYESTIASRTIHYADAVTAISQQASPPGRDVTIIPNGITALPRPEIEGADEPSGLNTRIVAVGRLVPSKGFDILIRSLALTEGLQIDCIIVGDDHGDLRRLRKIASEMPPHVSIRFPGYMNRQEISNLFACSDLVVMPSLSEPFGLVAFEALLAGKRVVATQTGGLGEWLSASELPVQLVIPKDVYGMSQAITTALRLGKPSPCERAAVVQLCQCLDWKSISTLYLEKIDYLLTRSIRAEPSEEH